MNKVKCVNGHFFDSDRFESCPICGAEVGAVVKAAPPTPARVADKISSTTPLLETDSPVSPELSGTEKAEVVKESPIDELAPTEMHRQEDQSPEEGIVPGEKVIQETLQQSETDQSIRPQRGTTTFSQDSLRKAVEATASTRVSALPKTVAYYDFDAVEPPVGWLVCVKGEYIGRAFECTVGRNRIGRSQDMEINLANDLTVTREVQAIIIFDPKKKQFFIQAGTGDGLVYLNGEMVFSHELLAPYDVISLGKTEFIFLPLCGEKFSWDKYIKEG